MPYTAKQRRYFHAQAAKGKPGMAKLAKEADAYAKSGKEKPPVKKSTQPMPVTRKQAPYAPAMRTRIAGPGKRMPMPENTPAWVEMAQAMNLKQGPKRTPRKAK